MAQALLFWEWAHPECEVGVEPCICVCLLICLLQTMERELGNNFKSKNGGNNNFIMRAKIILRTKKVVLLLKKKMLRVCQRIRVYFIPVSLRQNSVLSYIVIRAAS